MFKHACPECAVDLEVVPELTDIFWCSECDTKWIVCPDCGNLTDMGENWDYGQGVCDDCAITDNECGITLLTFDDPEELFQTLEQIFGDPNQ